MKNKQTKELRINCDCGGYHYFEITKWLDDGDMWLAMINADNTKSWYKRIFEAIGYVLGKPLYFHEVVLTQKDLQKLKKFINNL